MPNSRRGLLAPSKTRPEVVSSGDRAASGPHSAVEEPVLRARLLETPAVVDMPESVATDSSPPPTWFGKCRSPLATTTNNNNDPCTKGVRAVELVWRNLTYTVSRFHWKDLVRGRQRGYSYRQLLDSISGSVRSGELVAIMGPSGAGKTTLIECISGRRRLGVTGDISVSGGHKRTKLAYNAQDDSLMPCLTVYETLLFASKLRNYQRNNRLKVKLVDDNENVYNATTYPDADLVISLTDEAYHRNLVHQIIHKLGLDPCQNVRAENCSGGQQKRLSIALELIHSPTILILDEPTSGLDSVSCLQCVSLLRQLAHSADQPMAIAASIHQPTARILHKFDRLYVIARNGQCMYDGPTDQLVAYLAKFALTCPTYHNPADYVLEVASGDYGLDATRRLVEAQKERHETGYVVARHAVEAEAGGALFAADPAICEQNELVRSWPDETDNISIGKICKISRKQVKRRELYKTWILWTRCFLLSLRDPTEYLMRIFSCFAIILLNVVLYYDSNVGKADGCSQDNLKHLMEMLQSDYSSNQSFSLSDSLLEGPGSLAILNFGFIFFAMLFIAFLSMMPVILTFPVEVGVFYKEYFNGWYSFSSYFLAKNITNLIPTIVLPIIFGSSAYFITGQIWQPWRFLYFIAIMVLIAVVADGVGVTISALFVHNVNAASIFAAVSQIPLLLFTGLLVQIKTLPSFIQPLTYLSYYRLSFEASLIVLYGYGRCSKPQPLDMKQLRLLLGDDAEEVVDCVWTHSSLLQFGEGQTSHSYLSDRLSKFIEAADRQNPSLIMENFDLADEDLYFDLLLLLIYAVAARILAYIVLYKKATAQK